MKKNLEQFYELCYYDLYNGEIFNLVNSCDFTVEELENGLLYMELSSNRRWLATYKSVKHIILKKIKKLKQQTKERL